MNPRIINSLFGLIALAGIGIGVYSWMSTQSSNPRSSRTPSPTITLSPLSTPITLSTPLTPTPLPSITPKPFNESQNLSLPNRVETVGIGGNLVSIASKYGVTISQLTKINNLANPDKLLAGQTIIIPDSVTDTDYTILYTLNENRLTSEKKRIITGTKSIYQDPITATLADANSLFGIASDAPFSTNSNELGTAVTLTTTNDTWFIAVGLEKLTDGFWTIKRIIAKNKTKTETSATPKAVL